MCNSDFSVGRRAAVTTAPRTFVGAGVSARF
jgi:hypothetical protein